MKEEKTTYIAALHYNRGYFDEDFKLNDGDIKILKEMAKSDGRDLKTFLTRKIKLIARKK